MKKQKLRPTLAVVVLQLVCVVFVLLSIRWFLFEPFTVPSGSMFPNLLVNDYIIVNKLSAGVKIPMTNLWLIGPYKPKRGLATVFWFEKGQVYFVKRLMGLPGDELKIKGHQVLEINGQAIETQKDVILWNELKNDFPFEDSNGEVTYTEKYQNILDMGVKQATLMYVPDEDAAIRSVKVPKDKLFFMGDHRSSSSDGREWGFVDMKDYVGPVSMILFSCKEKNPSTQMCDFSTVRWNRLFSKYNKQ